MSKLEECKEHLKILFNINTPIVFIESDDFRFVDQLIYESSVVNKQADRIFEWNAGTTYTDFETGAVPNLKEKSQKMNDNQSGAVSLVNFLRYFLKNNPDVATKAANGGIILLKNVRAELEKPEVKTCLQLIARKRFYSGKNFKLHVVIVDAARPQFPPEIEKYIELLEIPFPDNREIEELIQKYCKKHNLAYRRDEKLSATLRGLSRFEIRKILYLAYGSSGNFYSEQSQKFLLEQKKQIVKKSSLLEYIETSVSIDDIGGLVALKKYLAGEQPIFADIENAKKNGIPAPKGIFILGMPGCGKSMTAKAAAGTFGVPLLKMDMGGLLGKYVGDSEANLRSALRTAEAIAPCVLWIDEIEKAFAGISGGNSGSDVMRRLFGYFIGWMQDKTKPVYVIATANKVEDLPPELKRKGRFDEIFCTLLPTKDERAEIFKAHIEKKQKEIEKNGGNMKILCATEDDYQKFADACGNDRFNGADIESVVNAALKKCFAAKRNVSKEDIEAAIKETHPIGDTCRTQIEEMKTFFDKNIYIDAGTGEATGKNEKEKNEQREKLVVAHKKALDGGKYAEALQIREILKTL